MDRTDTRRSLVVRAVVGVTAVLLGTLACSLNTDPSGVPTTAHIQVSGSTSSLELIVSTDFTRVVDSASASVTTVPNAADTLTFTPPYDDVWPLTSQARVAVWVRNPSATEIPVRLRVQLDNGQSFDQTVSIADPQRLSYIYVYHF